MEIIVTPKKEKIRIDMETGKTIKLKVAGYARVSTDLEDQKNSFEFQKEEFETRIKQNPDWEFVDMYSDEGISGTSTKNREGFLQMIKDAKAGKINHILCKSISRFARNTVDFLNYVRELAKYDVSVYFEKENLTTNKGNIDLILTLYASLAESESRSISENVKWGVRKRMSRNERKVPVRGLVGYSQNKDGTWYINEDAYLIRNIFNYFLEGYTFRQIVSKIKRDDEKKDRLWDVSKISRILKCEKYKGYIIHQKTVVIDVLTHTTVKNDGIEPQYTIKGHHDPIIPEEEFDYVQLLLKTLKGKFNERENSNYKEFSGMVVCEDCGRILRRITYPYNNEVVLTCKINYKTDSEYKPCESSVVPLEPFKEMVIEACSKIRKNNSIASSLTSTLIHNLADNDFVEEIKEVNKKLIKVNQEINELVKEQINNSSDEYPAEFAKLKSQRSLLQKELNNLQDLAKNNYVLQRNLLKIDSFLSPKNDFDYLSFKSLVYKIIHRKDDSFRFVVKGPGFNELSQEKVATLMYEVRPALIDVLNIKETPYRYDVVIIGGDKNA